MKGFAGLSRSHVELGVLTAVIGLGALLRVLLLVTLPRFFGPHDPATYFAMANGVLKHGVPRIDFVWNYSTLPAAISHIESYHEFAYAYLLAGAMAVFGSHAVVGCVLSLVSGVTAPLLTFFFARRFGPRVAIVAAGIVALEPWSIYYSGVLMKETFISVVALLAMEGLRRLMISGARPVSVGLTAAAIVLGASLFQYEMLPILALATALSLALLRRDALPAYLLATGVVAGAATLLTLATLGVPISGKFAFFMGHRLWTTEAHGHSSYASPLGFARFLPLPYVLVALLIKWYVPILVLAWLGSRARQVHRADLVLPVSFTACYLYFHGVPHDLWERDFIPLLPILAPLAALGVCRAWLWTIPLGSRWRGWEHVARGAFATGMIGGALAGVMLTYTLHVKGVFPARWLPWTSLTITFGVAVVIIAVLRRMSFLFRLRIVRRVIPVVGIGVILAAYSQSLPWAWIYANPQFPVYEHERALREDGCALLRDIEVGAPVMADLPAEIQMYSGHPAVLMPITHDIPTILALRERYGVRYLLAAANELSPSVPVRLSLRPVSTRSGYVLYAFPGEVLAVTPPLRGTVLALGTVWLSAAPR